MLPSYSDISKKEWRSVTDQKEALHRNSCKRLPSNNPRDYVRNIHIKGWIALNTIWHQMAKLSFGERSYFPLANNHESAQYLVSRDLTTQIAKFTNIIRVRNTRLQVWSSIVWNRNKTVLMCSKRVKRIAYTTHLRYIWLYSISQEICPRFLLCCALLWLYIDWFSHIHQAYFTGTVAI